MPTLPLLLLDVDIEGLAARIELNGVSVFRSDGGRAIRENRRLNGWALPAGNVVEIRLGRPNRDTASFRFDLRIVEPGQAPDGPAPIVFWRWSEEEDPLTPDMRAVFEAPVAFSAPRPWTWSTAVTGALTPDDRQRITRLLLTLRQSLAIRQSAALLDLQSVQLEELAIAVGDDPGRYREQYSAFLADFFGDPAFQVDPFDAAELRLEVMAGGRIVHATQGDRPAIRAGTGERTMGIDPYLSRIAGRWTVVR